MISSPPRPDDYPDRDIDCQEALEAEFKHIVHRSVDAGWTESEVEFALLCLALAQIKQTECNIETDEQIMLATRTIEGQ